MKSHPKSASPTGTPVASTGARRRRRSPAMDTIRWSASAILVAGLGIIGASGILARDDDGEKEKTDEKAKPAERVVVDKATIVFDDGDTFRAGDRDIRVLGVDTPETIHEDHGIFVNQPGGPEASAFTKKAIEEATEVVLLIGRKDRYGRTLGHVYLDGELLAVKLIAAGHGYETISKYGENGFPEEAAKIREAAKTAPKPTFEKPWNWRRKNQKREKKGEKKPEKKDETEKKLAEPKSGDEKKKPDEGADPK